MKNLSTSRLILFFTRGVSLRTWDEGGMLEREVALYRALRPHLRRITFVTWGDARDLDYGDRLGGIDIICNRWRLPGRLYAAALARLCPLLWRGNVIIKSNQVPGADVALRAARRARARFVARCGYLHSDFAERRHGRGSAEFRRAAALEGEVFPAADRVVVTTGEMRRTIIERYNVPEERTAVIPNYVETERFCPTCDRTGKPRRICFVGRFVEQKNLPALVEAVAGLGVQLVLTGKGHLERGLRASAARNGVSAEFVGNRPHNELPGLLNSCDLFVLPSHYEGHPKALLEAMACGLPAVGADVPGIRDVIRDGETGLLCGTDPAGIRSAVSRVLADADLRERLGRNAREYVVRNCDLGRVVEMELALLEGLAR